MAGTILYNPFSYAFAPGEKYISKRPPVDERLFTSKAIEDIIVDVKSEIKDPALSWIFENCLPNTLDTTVYYKENDGRPETHIITGDIDAM